MRRALLVLALLALPVQAWRAMDTTREGRSFLRGVAAHRGGEYAQALPAFEAARAGWMADRRAWAWSGDAALLAYDTSPAAASVQGQQALLGRAWTGYAGAVLRCPADSWSWAGLAEIALRRAAREDAGRPIDLGLLARRRSLRLDPQRALALAAARISVELKPGGFQELDVLGQVYEALGDVERAHQVYVQSARTMPAPSFHVWGAGQKLAPALYRAVLEGLERGVAEAPRFSRSLMHWEIGNFALGQGEPARALTHFDAAQRAASAPHERYHAFSDGGRALEKLGRMEEALASYRKALAYNLVPEEDAMRVASLEVKMGRGADACRDLLLALRVTPHDEERRLWTGTVCEQAGELRLAERVLKDGIATPLRNPKLARALLDLQARMGKTNSARGMLEAWIRRYPESAELQRWRDELPPPQVTAP